ncbi:CoA transferase [Actinosynnema sp. NPDC047251]|uniref:CoA-transferase n=1 Tax=Saccharothrix espanaensis (strain ATCC 51144 / DSM 44229 / JCM 9112 / NBRC 15066 / NRRL 15764) TaxID=1179773 RepID=K0JX05_SACES|nr:CoA transferase [Saccharothrix espanaensis]CCH32405.1 CoA-transferase [Saccharothrix espanaensis DSM 44229]
MPDEVDPIGDKPLSGIKIVDLTRVLAGPYCTMILADHGARVIKVERPPGGDDSRHFGSYGHGRSAYFDSVNRNKESIALDLRSAPDREVFEELLADADVLTENFRPGVMRRLGYGWPELHARFPSLIHGSVSGFGGEGSPHRDRPAYDMVVQGMSGMMSVTGQPGGPPTRVGVSVGDLAAGLFLTVGITMSLLRRARTGVGNQVDIAMLDCQLALLEYSIGRHLTTGETPGPVGTYRPAVPPPFGSFRTADGYLVIAAGNDKLFAALCTALGRPDLAQDSRFVQGEARKDHEPALQREIEALLAQAGTGHWCAVLGAAGVPCGPINTVDRMLADPHVAARSMLVDVDGGGALPKVVGTPIKFSDVADLTRVTAAPDLDQDRARILAELAARTGGVREWS